MIGAESAQIAAAARDNRVYLVVGVIERAGSTLYCTVLMYAPDGTLLGKHRKLMPTAVERLIWGMGDGSTLTVIDSPIGRFGSVICWENYMPLLRMAMYAQGIEIYCAPTVDDRETWLPTMRTIAIEGRCFVLSACQFLPRADAPAGYAAPQGGTPDAALIRGGSCIVDPFARCWPHRYSAKRRSASRNSIGAASRAANSIWTWWVTMRVRMSFVSR